MKTFYIVSTKHVFFFNFALGELHPDSPPPPLGAPTAADAHTYTHSSSTRESKQHTNILCVLQQYCSTIHIKAQCQHQQIYIVSIS